jgi:hypothetical protein
MRRRWLLRQSLRMIQTTCLSQPKTGKARNILCYSAKHCPSLQPSSRSSGFSARFLSRPAALTISSKMTNPVTGKEIWYYEMVIKPFVSSQCAKLSATLLISHSVDSADLPWPTPCKTRRIRWDLTRTYHNRSQRHRSGRSFYQPG